MPNKIILVRIYIELSACGFIEIGQASAFSVKSWQKHEYSPEYYNLSAGYALAREERDKDPVVFRKMGAHAPYSSYDRAIALARLSPRFARTSATARRYGGAV